MNDTALALRISEVVAGVHGDDSQQPDGDESPNAERMLEMIAALGDVARVAGSMQAEAVRSAHANGLSWADIGRHLGVSRQAVQQKFDPNYRQIVIDAEGERILGPVSRGEELEHLQEAGRQGWQLVSSRHGEHTMRRTDEAWEVRRVSALSPRRLPSEEDGWHAVAIRFPDCFYIRAAGPRPPA